MGLKNVWKLCKFSRLGARNSILTQSPVYTLQWSVFSERRTVCCSYFYKRHLNFTVRVLATLVCFDVFCSCQRECACVCMRVYVCV